MVEQYRSLARYNTWMNDKVYRAARSLSDEKRREDRGAFFKSVHGTLNHLLLADRVWMGRFTGDKEAFASRDITGKAIVVTSLSQELYADFDELTQERRRTDEAIEAFVDALEPERLAAEFRYQTMKGDSQSHVMWWALSHVFNHQTHHRGQVTTLLTQLGADVGVTDLLAFLRAPHL
jgi:uncharacterized damage-inducible protein DinB